MIISFPSTKAIKDSIRDAIGQDATFVFEGDVIECSLCSASGLYDPINETSLDSWCPTCSGAYFLPTDVEVDIKSHVRWNYGDQKDMDSAGYIPLGDCSITIDKDDMDIEMLVLRQDSWDNNSACLLYNDYWIAQTFTLPFLTSISSVAILASRWKKPSGQPGDLTISVRATGIDDNNHLVPSGSDLAVGAIDAGIFTTSDQGDWHTVTLDTPISIPTNTSYALIFRCANADASNYLNFFFSMKNPYMDGRHIDSDDGGVTWTPYWDAAAGYDCSFRIYGTVSGEDTLKEIRADDRKLQPYRVTYRGTPRDRIRLICREVGKE